MRSPRIALGLTDTGIRDEGVALGVALWLVGGGMFWNEVDPPEIRSRAMVRDVVVINTVEVGCSMRVDVF
jgi:hypothetical protein